MEIQKILDGYYDGELDLIKSLDIEQHLKSCRDCTAILNNYKILHNTMHDKSFYYLAPAELKSQIIPILPKKEIKPVYGINNILNWRNASFVLAILLIISFFLPLNLRENSGDEELTTQVVNSHLRSLVGGSLTDVLSSDNHTVKPWFNGKLNFSPPVFDLAGRGFPLTGGRIDYINNRQAAVLVYHYNKHIINLYISQNNNLSHSNPEIYSRSGYNIIHWMKNGMEYWAVSDVNPEQLKKFNEEFERNL
jgi:anti-sigma factor RsiW